MHLKDTCCWLDSVAGFKVNKDKLLYLFNLEKKLPSVYGRKLSIDGNEYWNDEKRNEENLGVFVDLFFE